MYHQSFMIRVYTYISLRYTLSVCTYVRILIIECLCSLLTAYGKTKSLPGKSCKDIQDKLSEPCISKLYNLYKTGVFWVKVKDPCTGEEESIQVNLIEMRSEL